MDLIKKGYVEELKLTMRPLENRMLKEARLDKFLYRTIDEIFLNWNFDADKSYTVFLLEPNSDNRESVVSVNIRWIIGREETLYKVSSFLWRNLLCY